MYDHENYPIGPNIFNTYKECVNYMSLKYEVPIEEIIRCLKKLKKLGLVRFSTKSKNKFIIKFNDPDDFLSEENSSVFQKLATR